MLIPIMNTYTIHLTGQPDGHPKTITLPGIPRAGDEFDFGSNRRYGVRRVIWSLGTPEPTIFACLTCLDESGNPTRE